MTSRSSSPPDVATAAAQLRSWLRTPTGQKCCRSAATDVERRSRELAEKTQVSAEFMKKRVTL